MANYQIAINIGQWAQNSFLPKNIKLLRYANSIWESVLMLADIAHQKKPGEQQRGMKMGNPPPL